MNISRAWFCEADTCAPLLLCTGVDLDLSRDSVEVDAIMHPELDAEGEPVPELLTIQQLTTDPCLGGPVSQPHMTPYYYPPSPLSFLLLLVIMMMLALTRQLSTMLSHYLQAMCWCPPCYPCKAACWLLGAWVALAGLRLLLELNVRSQYSCL